MKTTSESYKPTFGRLVPVCNAHGISRTKAFEYASKGLLETFLIDGSRYVYYASIETLPKRIAESQKARHPVRSL